MTEALRAAGIGGHSMKVARTPAAFNDSRTVLGGTSALYYAKLRRGGMGTGMPGFGPLFTREETWALVDFLWSFALGSDPG